jgi:hypothetical protein
VTEDCPITPPRKKAVTVIVRICHKIIRNSIIGWRDSFPILSSYILYPRPAISCDGLRPESKSAVSSVIDQRERVAVLSALFARNAASVIAIENIPVSAMRGEIARRIHQRLESVLAKPSNELQAVVSLTTEVAHCGLPYSAISTANMFGRRPSLFYTNSFLRFPGRDLEFGGKSNVARPLRVVPHNLGHAVLIWPAPPSAGGLELYFGGTLAPTVKALGDTDPWWEEMRCFDPP